MKPKVVTKGQNLKRKLKGSASVPRKKIKISSTNIDKLPWKSASHTVEAGFDDDMLGIEEVEGVEIVYEETEKGKLVKFNVLETPTNNDNDLDKEVEGEEPESNEETDSVPEQEEEETPLDFETLLPEWQPYALNHRLSKALFVKKFTSPTPIQAAALPFAFKGKDVVGIAQTGSGKTLAYGLPILHHLLCQKRPASQKRRPLRALIITPTRELSLQVSSHLEDLLKAGETNGPPVTVPGQQKSPPYVSVATIVGGMSAQKQRRMLERGADIVVATPGRLWDMIEEDSRLSLELEGLKFLVLDEADRMIEVGHYAELENILRLTLRDPSEEAIGDDIEEPTPTKNELQTFVFSATLSKDLQRNLKKPLRPKFSKKKQEAPASTLGTAIISILPDIIQPPSNHVDDLLLRLDFRDPDPEIIDLSPEGNLISTLKEGRINCLSADKDSYLYYFFLRYPGRSLVFLSSIDGIRRLLPLMELLTIKAFPLHSQLEQRQRLKNLDRFKNIPNAVLLATDIAARGLDIPAVDHVIHFQIPRTADTYVHRNGRTARANRRGFSMLMCAPDERRIVKALMNSLRRDETEIQELDIELSMLDKIKARVQLARQIETSQHKVNKTNHDRHWMKETAEALGVDLDSDFVSDDGDEDNHTSSVKKGRDNKIGGLKNELKRMLSAPLIGRGVSAKFITSGARPIISDLLAGELNDNMVGVRKAEAGSEMVKGRKKSQPKAELKGGDEVDADNLVDERSKLKVAVVKGGKKYQSKSEKSKITPKKDDSDEVEHKVAESRQKRKPKGKLAAVEASINDTAKSDAGSERIKKARLKAELRAKALL